MNNPFKNEADQQKRIQLLIDNCHSVETMTYPRSFTEEETQHKKDNLSEQIIQIQKLEEDKKEAMKDFKHRIDEAKTEMFLNLQGIRTGVEEVTEEVYLVDNQEEGRMDYYNKEGDIIKSRPLRKDERQLRLFAHTGTEN